MFSPCFLINLMNSSLSVVENCVRSLAISARLRVFAVTTVVMSLLSELVAQAHGFLSGQLYIRWPYLPHLKQHPSFLHFSFLALVIALHATADVSIASRFFDERYRWGDCLVGQFP